MTQFAVFLTVISFLLTLVFVMWRPRGLKESIPAAIGAILVIISGSVSSRDLVQIIETISGAAFTILSTIVMAIVLESFGFFLYAAELLAQRARNSGVRLFWYINLLCFSMTLFFNNDGSILITTPILILLLRKIGLRPHQQTPYLLSGALIATSSSTPIGVSNIVNLISLKIIGLNLDQFTEMIFVPAMLGLGLLLFLLFLYFRKELPQDLDANRRFVEPQNTRAHPQPNRHERHRLLHHPLRVPPPITNFGDKEDGEGVNRVSNATKETLLGSMDANHRLRFMRNVFLYVLLVRVSLFVVAYFGVPVSVAAVVGAVLLFIWRWVKLGVPPTDLIKKAPWHNLLFVFSMYIIVYGLYKAGLPALLVAHIRPLAVGGFMSATFTMGILLTLMSCLFNNNPALMIGTLTLKHIGLSLFMEKVAYLGSIVGSDMGSLLLPMGTLASLMWMHILKRNHIPITWRKYIEVTAIVIPVTVLFTLVFLALWIRLVF